MKKKKSRLFSVLLRIDNLNRILVFLAMVLFLILPSLALYHVYDDNNNLPTVLPCLLLLGTLLGTGALALDHPEKVTPFFFLEILLLMASYYDEIRSFPLFGVQIVGVSISEMVYCLICFSFSSFCLILLTRRRSSRKKLLEGTNHDSFLEFVSARDNNKEIVDKLLRRQKNTLQFSRWTRLISGSIHLLLSFGSFLLSLQGQGESAELLQKTSALSVALPLILILLSWQFPRAYKYVFYYNSFLFAIALLFFGKEFPAVFLLSLFSLIALFLSFLLTLVVEGRTWMGAEMDD